MSVTKPTVGGSNGTWGTELNAALDQLDTAIGDKADGGHLHTGVYIPYPASGTTGHVLTKDPAATGGIKWAAAGGGGSLTVQDENSNVSTSVTQIDFQGSAVAATSGSGEVIVTISAAPLQETVNTVAATGSTETIPDVTSSTISDITLDANCTLTFPTAAAGKSFTLVVHQDGTGGRTITWPGTVKWASAAAPTLTSAASKIDVFTFLCVNGTNWLGFTSGQDMA
jgi:hypothetical protein